MSWRPAYVLLVLSALLNTFFIAGFVFRGWIAPMAFEHRMPPPPPPGPRPGVVEFVANEAELDDAQRQALRPVLDQYIQARRERLRGIQKLRDEIGLEYRRTPIEPARLDPLIDQLGTLRVEQQRDTIRVLARIQAELRPEQQVRMHDVMAERLGGPVWRPAPGPQGHPPGGPSGLPPAGGGPRGGPPPGGPPPTED